MADYSIAAVTRRAVYTGSAGTGPYAFTFALLATSDIAVYKNATKLTETSDYSVTLSASTGQGSVTLSSAASSDDTITLVGARALARTTDFVTSGSLTASALNTDLDSLVIFAQQLSEENSRNLKAPVTEGISGTTDMTIPAKATRASKILEFDSDGNPAVSITATSLSTLAGITGDITTVAGISSNVTTVAGISSNVSTVAGISSEVSSVAAKASLITSDFVADLNTLATSAIVTDLNILGTADVVADLALLATSDIVSDINTLATSDIVSDLNTLATSAIVADLNILATSDNVTNMATLGASGVVTNIASVAGSISNVNTVASNISGVNSFAARYRVASSDPSSDNDAGDLVFNTSSNVLKVYNGSSFDDVTGSTLAGLSDTNITSPADGSILLYDTGTSKYIDNVISGDATLADSGALTIADDAITTAKIADDAITSALIADDAISEEHLDPTIISSLADTTIDSSDHIMFFDATDSALKKVDAGELIQTPTVLRPNVRPLIHNGEMQIAQYGDKTGITGTQYVCDRFCTQMDTFGTWSMSQSTDVPTGKGYKKSLKLDCTTADTSLGAGHFGMIRTSFEGRDLQLIKKGTSSAEKLTLKFYVKSAKTGTYTLELFDTDNSRQISKTYTVDSANTWEEKIINIPADTTGAFTYDANESFVISWWLGAGSTYSGGTVNTSAFASSTNANRVSGSNVNLADSTSNDWFLTGVQLEIGEYTSATIPAFQHQEYNDDLLTCHRYFITGAATENGLNPTAEAATTTAVQPTPQLRRTMRVAPTLTANAVSFIALIGGSGTTTTLAFSNMGQNGFRYGLNHNTTLTTGQNVAMGGLGADFFAEFLAQS